MEKINVNLYGGKGLFGGRETPLEADIIYCDRTDQCTYYKENKCLRCRSFLSPTCKFGSSSVVKGYTSRARKYFSFKRQYTEDTLYNKLKYPNELAAIMGDTLFMNLKYTSVYKRTETTDKWHKDVEGYIITDKGFGTCEVFIPLKEVTNTLLHAIFSFTPHTLMRDGIIREYQLAVVPDIIHTLKKIAPDIYHDFITAYPEYDTTPNYVGKYAYIKTMVDGSELEDNHGNKFILKDNKLYCEEYRLSFVPFKAGIARMEIDVTDKMTYKITNNNQCDENTKFD